MDPKTYPAITVSNIKTFIPITLEMDTSQYSSWAELFKIHCRAFSVLDHLSPCIITTTAATASNTPPAAAATEATASNTPADDVWDRLDAIVLQWIYGTISNDLLSTIIRPESTACYAWVALQRIFHDNQATRSVLLKQKFAMLKLASFPNMFAYCQEVKVLSDQLANVGSPVSERDLVIQLITGLSEAMGLSVQSFKTPNHSHPSMRLGPNLFLKKPQKRTESPLKRPFTPLSLTTLLNPKHPILKLPPLLPTPEMLEAEVRGRGRGTHQPSPQWTHYPWFSQPTTNQTRPPTWSPPTGYFWTAPPCPYPTIPQSRPQQGILGPRPQQAFTASETPYMPTALDQAFNAFTLNPPDQTWYMDSGASGPPHSEAPPSM